MLKEWPAAGRAVAGVCLLALTFAGFNAVAAQPAVDYGKLPLFFEANQGQAGEAVRYLTRGAGNAIYFEKTAATLRLTGSSADGKTSKVDAVRFVWQGARTRNVTGLERLPGVSNYILGNDRAAWKTDIAHFAKVKYSGLYNGIDLVYYGHQGKLEYDLIVGAGADPAQAKFRMEGIRGMRVAPDGDLLIETSVGELRHHKPVAYQEFGSERHLVDAAFQLASNDTVGFRLGSYDRSKPLVIDPVVAYAAFFGGTEVEQAESIAVDGNGNAYITGQTFSTDIGTVSAGQPNYAGAWDAFVMKINAAGNQILYATYLGGSGFDIGHGIAVDATGSAYVVGETASTNFPLASAAQGALRGVLDSFLTRLSPTGTALAFSTYLGGTGRDYGRAVALDAANNAYVAGYSESPTLDLLVAGQTFSGVWDAFLMKVNANGSLGWSAFAGGTGNDRAYDVAVDRTSGNIYIGGETSSTNLAGVAFQPGNRGGVDGFVAKFASGGTRTYWAYLGGSSDDRVNGITVDGTGNVYAAGDTASTNFHAVSASQGTTAGQVDAFVTKINSVGSAILWSTYLGGSAEDRGTGVAVDAAGSVYTTGYTISPNFPVSASAKGTPPGTAFDAFVTKFNSAGVRGYSSLFGGTLAELSFDIAVDAAGSAYITGRTRSGDMPVTLAGSSLKGDQDAFVAKLAEGACAYTVSPATLAPGAGGGLVYITVDTGAGCTWQASSPAGFATIAGGATGAGRGWVALSVQPNPGVARSTTLTVAGQQVPLSQGGSITQGCTYGLTGTPAANLPSSGGTGALTLTPSTPACAWGAYSTTAWLQVFPLTGTGTGQISYTVFPNFSTAARTGTIVAGGQTFTVSQVGNALTPNQRFVQLLYFSYFGRLPSQGEIDFQVNEALNRGVSRGELATNFLGTPEFNQGGRFVAGLYVGLLNRDAEYGGWLFQRNALAVNSVTQDSLVQNFLNSGEYSLKFGNPDNAAFVRLLYRYVLLREAADAEVAFQVAALTSGTTRVALARNFLNSAEFRNGTGPRLTAFLLYATLLLRDPSPGEFESRVAQLSGGSPVPVRTLVDQIVASAEFNSVLQ